MNDFTKDFAQALFNPDKINDLLRKELQQAVNNLLEAELTAFLGYAMIPMPEMAGILAILEMVLISARLIPSLDQLKCKCLETAMDSFITA